MGRSLLKPEEVFSGTDCELSLTRGQPTAGTLLREVNCFLFVSEVLTLQPLCTTMFSLMMSGCIKEAIACIVVCIQRTQPNDGCF